MLLCSIVLGLVTGQINQAPEATTVTGQEWIKGIESNYQAGKYKNFLDEMDRYYQAGQNQNSWKFLVDSENELIIKYNTPAGKKLIDDLTAKSKQYNEAVVQLKKERNQQLQKIAAGFPKAPVSQMISDRLNQELTPQQMKSLELFQEWISPFPFHAETPLLKQLKAVNFESNVKELLLGAAYQQGGQKSSEIPYFGKLTSDQLDEFQVVLTLDKLNKMQNLAQKSNEQDLKGVIATVSKAFPILASQIYDSKAIERYVKKPSTPVEEDVAKVIQSYDKKRNETLKKFGLAK